MKVPGLIFLSGQVPVDESGKIVDGGIQEHTVRLRYVLHAEVYGLIGGVGEMHLQPRRSLGSGRIVMGEGRQSQRVPQGYERLCRYE